MFESITLTKHNIYDQDNPVDIGALVECMLFYEKVSVIADRNVLVQIMNYFGIDRVLMLIDEGFLNIVFSEAHIGIHRASEINSNIFTTCVIATPQFAYEERLREILIRLTGKSGKGRRIAKKYQDRMHFIGLDNIVTEGASKSILDNEYFNSATKIVIKNLVPEISDISGLEFYTEKTNEGILINSNLDFVAVNEMYHRRMSKQEYGSITYPLIMSYVAGLEIELHYASLNASELLTNNLNTELSGKKIDYLLYRSTKSKTCLNNFEEFVFNSSMSIRESVNSNSIDLDDLVHVLQRSKKFKKWVIGVDPDIDLAKSYYEEVAKEGAFDKLPGKTFRWSMFTGAGIVADALGTGGAGFVAGLALGALDTFYIDNLISGWKPNSFIKDVNALITSRK